RERLRQWASEEGSLEDTWHRHELATNHWRSNIYAAERLKHQRAQQDQNDNLNFVVSTLQKLERILKGPCALFEEEESPKWQLDETESRNRMRIRVIPDRTAREDDYRPKRRATQTPEKRRLTLNTTVVGTPSQDIVGTPAAQPSAVDGSIDNRRMRSGSQSMAQNDDASAAPEDEYEIIEDPKEDDGFEDKNRKVMRSLQHGDQIKHVCNVSRIVGLEAAEGLLIVGKDSLYLLDNYFQRADGEVVGVWQAPTEERDPYLRMISGRETSNKKPQVNPGEETTRNWMWAEVISVSKRRFLFRDVAIEVFFTDGRSYLLTTNSPALRNDLYSRLVDRAPAVSNPSSSQHMEDMWRIESLRNPEE
ncbi:hypothetical protein LTS18_001208, partial [Coniosporium uncinatum]